VVALTTVTAVPATPPNDTPVVPVKTVPVSVTDVPPVVEPLDGEIDVTVVAAVMISDAALATGVGSEEVATVNPAAAYVAAAGFVTPAIVKVPALFLGNVHPLGSVTTTLAPVVTPVAPALQSEKLVPKVIVGDAGTVNALLNTAVIVPPAGIGPVVLSLTVVKPTVQVVVTPLTCDAPENETAVTADAG